MKFILKKSMEFGNSIENPDHQLRNVGEEIFMDNDFKVRHNLYKIEDIEKYSGTWGWFEDKLNHICQVYFSDIKIEN